ncbi:MAG: hypothetical protein FJ318_09040 [SAR202 cluster bacterium]|nr:hypothetical protein [SAR202 cluster bacterium]
MMTQVSYAMQPTRDEVVSAILAGYRAIDDGQGFYYGFDNHLMSLGYTFQAEHECTCPDRGGHGHMPECRWLKSWPSRDRKQGSARPRFQHVHDDDEPEH